MNHPFSLGQSYDRQDLLAFVGSRQGQSGIIWGPKQLGVVICTSGGRHGAKAGYLDGPSDDGTWVYFGQGEKGDQNPGGPANRLLVSGERSALLFLTREPTGAQVRARGNWRKQYAFAGEFCVGSWEFHVPSEGRRRGDRLIKFTFVPVSDALGRVDSKESDASSLPPLDLARLRQLLSIRGGAVRKGQLSTSDYFMRSQLLRQYAKQRAAGACERCGGPAPFLMATGQPFLEVHHILRLADDGPDEPKNVAALCPNCHRAAHHAVDADQIRKTLIQQIGRKEQGIN